MASVTHQANLHDAIPWLPTEAQLKLEIEGEEGIDAQADITIVEIDGTVVAEAQVWRMIRAGRPVFEVGGHVVPEVRGRGIGRALLAENVRRAVERAAADPVRLRAFADEHEAGHRAILTRAGFDAIRHFFVMGRRDLATVPDLPLPEGIEVRPVTADQHRAIFDAEKEAFKDHWESSEQGDDVFRTTFERPEIDTGLWVVAWDGDEIAGVVQTWIWTEENEGLGVKRGWLEHISVRRPWRRRGLGRAISAIAMQRLRDAGMDEAMLGVDSENPTGALGLYEELGFTVHTKGTAFGREVERA